MKTLLLALLVALLGAVILVPVALSEDEDPFDQRIKEDDAVVTKHGRALSKALEHAEQTGDYTALPEASGAYLKAHRDHGPSKLDMWEARQRLIELIYDSDDEEVFYWYVMIKESIELDDVIATGVAEIMAQVERAERNLDAQGVSLTPEALPPED